MTRKLQSAGIFKIRSLLAKRRRPQARPSAERHQMQFEALERRQVLTAVPIANPDPFYLQLTSSALSVTAGNGLLQNDFDADSSSLTVNNAYGAVNGSISYSSDGSFTFTPTTNFVGLASFLYTISDGTNTSAPAKATISFGTRFSPNLLEDEAGANNVMHTGAWTTILPISPDFNFLHRSDTIDPQPIIAVETIYGGTPSGTTISSIQTTLKHGATTVGSATYDQSLNPLTAGTKLRFALQAQNTQTYATGMYEFTFSVKVNYANSTDSTTTYTIKKAIVNHSNDGSTVRAPFGQGWWLEGLDQIYKQSNGMLWVHGDGSSHWFAWNGSSYDKARGDTSFSTLTNPSGGSYVITDKWGNTKTFQLASDNVTGLLVGEKKLNNVVAWRTYAYDSSKRLTTISDEFGRDWTFEYDSYGVASEFTDLVGKTSEFDTSTSDPGVVVVCRWPEPSAVPDPPPPADDPEIIWTCGTTNGRTTRVTNPDGVWKDPIYDVFGLVDKIQHPDNREYDFSPTLLQGLVEHNSTGNSLYVVADSINSSFVDSAWFENERNFASNYKTDQFGNVTQLWDSRGAFTQWFYSPENLLYKVIEADPDGTAGSQQSPVTEYGYNSSGDLRYLENPDDTTRTWTYDSTLHLVLTATNEEGETDTFTYDSVGNMLTRKDALNHIWTYGYDQTDSNSNNRHGRLLSVTSPDPDGGGSLQPITTTFGYESAGSNPIYTRLIKVTNPDNTIGNPSDIEFTYDSADNLSSKTDELGRVTNYYYDYVNRLRIVTLPAAQSGQSRPAYKIDYNKFGDVKKETDPLGNYTEYLFNDRGWVEDVKSYNASNSLLATTSYTYLGDRLIETLKKPTYSGTAVDEFTYDANGNLTQVESANGGITQYGYDYLNRMTTSEDDFDRLINFVYDNRSRLVEMIDHDPDGTGSQVGPTTVYGYDDASRLEVVTDPLGRTTVYDYYANGWLEDITLPDPDGSGSASSPVFSFSYDTLGRRTQVTDPLGHVTVTEYDVRSRISKITQPDPDGTGGAPAPYTTFEYDFVNNLTKVTEMLSRVTEYVLDNLDRPITVKLPDPDNNTSTANRPEFSYEYDLNGNVTKVTDPLGHFATVAYDGLNRPTVVTEPDADGVTSTPNTDKPVWEYHYGSNTLLEYVIDPMGHRSDYNYDDFGRLSSIEEPDPDGTGSLLRSEIFYQYDTLDRLVATLADPDGEGTGTAASQTDYDYDIYSRLTTVTDPNGDATNYRYDKANQLVALIDPLGNETQWAFDLLGRTVLDTNAKGHTRFFEYDAVGSLTRRTDRMGRLIQYSYDNLDRQKDEKWYAAVATANVAATTEGSGSANEVQTITVTGLASTGDKFQLGFAGELTGLIAYNASAGDVETALEALAGIDNVSVSLSVNGSTRTFTVTFQGAQSNTNVSLLQAAARPNSNGTLQRTATFGYDHASRLTSTADPTSNYSFTLDGLNRITAETHDFQTPSNILATKIYLAKTYDKAGNRLTLQVNFDFVMDDIITTIPDFKNTYVYDNLNRLQTVKQSTGDGTSVHAVAPKQVNMQYNNLGQLTYMNRFENLTATEPALRNAWVYDEANRLVELDYRNIDTNLNPTLLNEYDFDYDRLNRITAIESTLDGLSQFTYDLRSQITAANHASPRSDESYSYDDNGNRNSSGYSVAVNNQTTADGAYTYLYDAEGNRTRKTKNSDSGYEEYTWDHRDRLTKVSFKNSGGTEQKYVEYTYDIFNRLVRRKYDPDGSGSTQPTNLYLVAYDGINPTIAMDGTAHTDVSNRFLWGPMVDMLLADELVTSVYQNGNTLWMLSDQVGTIKDIVDYTSGAFSIVNHRTIDSFGKITAESNGAIDEVFAYTGKFFDDFGDSDPNTGLSNHWNRWYDPQLGKWVSEDPIGFASLESNISRFVGNAPANWVDRSGLIQEDENQPSVPPGMESWVWPWSPNANWGVGATTRLWWNKSCYYGGAGVCGAAQGGLNTINGLQDTVIGIGNLPAATTNGIAWVEEQVGILDGGDSIRVPYIPSPDWSRGLINDESGQPDTWSDMHGWSKFSGAFGVELWVGTKGAGKAGLLGKSQKVESPLIKGSELAGKTRKQIRALADKKGLEPYGDVTHVDYPRKWRDPITGEERIRLDRGHVDKITGKPYDNPNAAVDHVHGYTPDGEPIRVKGDPHIPTKGDE